MKKAMAIIEKMMILILITFVLTGCSKDSPIQDTNSDSNTVSGEEAKEEVKMDMPETEFYLVSEKHGFSMEAPGFWQGRVEISEDDNSFTVKHVTSSQEAPVQNPVIINVIEYGSVEKWEQDAKKENEPFPYEKMGVIDGKVFAYIPSFDFPYDDNSPADQEEYLEMMSSLEKVLNSFKPVNPEEAVGEQETAQGENKYWVAGIEDPVAFEQYFYTVQSLITKDDREAVVRYFSYPVGLNINNEPVTIENAQEMLEQYDAVFTQDVKKAVAEQKAENLFVNATGVMVGNGQLWFGVTEGEKYYILSVNP